MNPIKKITIDNKKYLQIFGFKIPYTIYGEEEDRIFKMGPFKLNYIRDAADGNVYLKLLGKRITIKESRRLKHYKMRRQLTDEKIKALLTEELEPMLGYKPDLNEPKTFNEKINWLKIYNKDPRVTVCCDKYAVKEYARERISTEYILPVLKKWDKAEDVSLDELPDRFVIKVNWSSGFNIIIKDKSKRDINKIKETLNKWMQPYANSYYDMFNWGYKNMKPVIYAEPYIEQFDGQVYDYKFYYSQGEFIYMFIATDRLGDHTLTYTFFDNEFKPLPFVYGGKGNAKPIPEMPKNLDKMLLLGKALADDFPFVRVDFYETDDGIYLGEMTFYSGGGQLNFKPQEWDLKLGEKIKI